MATANRTVEINGVTYSVGRLDVRKQLHVARRLAPMVGAMGGVLRHVYESGMFKIGEGKFDLDSLTEDSQKSVIIAGLETIETSAPLFANAIAKMSDADADFIIDSCLAVCKRQQGKLWSPVFTNGVIMFDDMELDGIVQLTWYVCKQHVMSFFPMNPRTPAAGAGKETLN
jgi:hypothetical protein